jgi:hypothetical protein
MVRAAVVLGILLGTCTLAQAQEAGQVGIAMGYPASIGIVWHVSDALAVRPEIGFIRTSTDSAFSSDATMVNVGASALYYMWKWDAVRGYVSPRFTYSHSSSGGSGQLTTSSTSSVYGVAGSFGVQYSAHKRFAVYAETGLGYSHSENSTATFITGQPLGSNPPTATSTTSSLSTRSGVGVIFYFK